MSSSQLDAVLSVPGTCTYTPAAGAVLTAGAQPLNAVCTPTDSTEYQPATKTVTLTVKQATLSVLADNKTTTYGSAIPTLTGTLTGVVNNDGITASYATTATSSSAPGSYPITASLNDPDGRDVDYSVTNTPGVLTVLPFAATPTFSPVAGTYASAQTVTIGSATSGATIYYTTSGATPTTGSAVYNGPVKVSFTMTLEAIAVAAGYSQSAVATASYVIANPAPVIDSLTPGYVGAGSTAFTLTVAGAGFVPSSIVYWGTNALTTTFSSATQLTAQVPASLIASAGTTAITVQTPSPGGGASNALQFEVDTAGAEGAPTFATLTATVTAGSSATYSVSLPASATDVSIVCLNLPPGASCSYSASSGAVTITTSSSTPAGTYQITMVFNETLPGKAPALILVLFLLIPLVQLRRKWKAAGIGLVVCAVLTLAAAAGVAGCGGHQTHTSTNSGTVTLVVH